MKLSKTSNIRIVQLCQELFHFELPSVQLARRRKVFSCKCSLVKVVFGLVLFLCYHCIVSTIVLVNTDLHSLRYNLYTRCPQSMS